MKFSQTNKFSKKKEKLNFINSDFLSFSRNFNFIKVLTRALQKKNVLINNINFSSSFNNIIYLRLDFFFCFNRIKFLKSKINKFKLPRTKNFIQKQKFENLFFKNLKFLKANLILIIVQNSNRYIELKFVKYFYKKLKGFIKIIFLRRFDLFLDLIRLTTLLIQKKATLNSFLFIISKIFGLLSKKKHNQFFFFIEKLFQSMLFLVFNYINIKGIKFLIKGKLQGKTRASSKKILVKSVPVQTFDSTIFFNKIHVHTVYGVFGLKLWIFYNEKS